MSVWDDVAEDAAPSTVTPLDWRDRQHIARREGVYILACGDTYNPLSREYGRKQRLVTKPNTRKCPLCHTRQTVVAIRLPISGTVVSLLTYRQARYELGVDELPEYTIANGIPRSDANFLHAAHLVSVRASVDRVMLVACLKLHPVDAAHLMWDRAFYPGQPHTFALVEAIRSADALRAEIIDELLTKAEHGNTSDRALYPAFGARAMWQHTNYDRYAR
jgi:hypothetical protein